MPRSTTSSKTNSPKSIHKPIPGPSKIPSQDQQIQIKSVQPTFKETLVQGFGWGIGSSLGSSLIRRMFESKINPELEKSPSPSIPPSNSIILDSNEIFKKYQECLEKNKTNTNCEILLDMSSK